MIRVGNLFDCPRVLKNWFNTYVLSSLQFCEPVWMSSAESLWGLLGSVVHSAVRSGEGELCCLGHKRKASALYLLHRLYHRVEHPTNEYLHHFIAARNAKASAALGESALVIPR